MKVVPGYEERSRVNPCAHPEAETADQASELLERECFDLLLTDESNPRSVGYQLAALRNWRVGLDRLVGTALSV